MELLEPFRGDGAGQEGLDLAAPAASSSRRVEGQVEIGVADDRLGGEANAPAADHQPGPLGAPPLDHPVGIGQQQPPEDLVLVDGADGPCRAVDVGVGRGRSAGAARRAAGRPGGRRPDRSPAPAATGRSGPTRPRPAGRGAPARRRPRSWRGALRSRRPAAAASRAGCPSRRARRRPPPPRRAGRNPTRPAAVEPGGGGPAARGSAGPRGVIRAGSPSTAPSADEQPLGGGQSIGVRRLEPSESRRVALAPGVQAQQRTREIDPADLGLLERRELPARRARTRAGCSARARCGPPGRRADRPRPG